jgi:hypothetical protein
MSTEESTPFNQDYVMNVTVRKAFKAIDTSIYKTSSRLEEFEENSEKWLEVFNTMHSLHMLKKVLVEFETHNEHLFNRNIPKTNKED